MRAAVTGIINKSLSGSRTKTPRLRMCTKPILIRFPHLHTYLPHLGGLWRPPYCFDKQRQKISLEQSAGLSVGGPSLGPTLRPAAAVAATMAADRLGWDWDNLGLFPAHWEYAQKGATWKMTFSAYKHWQRWLKRETLIILLRNSWHAAN